jgi:uncharacterized coiled-coil protein SlyX
MGSTDSPEGGNPMSLEDRINELEARLNTLDGQVSNSIRANIKNNQTNINHLIVKVDELSGVIEDISAMTTRIAEVEENYLEGRIQSAGFGTLGSILSVKMDELK